MGLMDLFRKREKQPNNNEKPDESELASASYQTKHKQCIGDLRDSTYGATMSQSYPGITTDEASRIVTDYESMANEQKQDAEEKERGQAFVEWCKRNNIRVTETSDEDYKIFLREYNNGKKGNSGEQGKDDFEINDSDENMLLL